MFGKYYNDKTVNDRVGLSNTDRNERGLIHDLATCQIKLFKAIFLRKWSFNESIMNNNISGKFKKISAYK